MTNFIIVLSHIAQILGTGKVDIIFTILTRLLWYEEERTHIKLIHTKSGWVQKPF